MGSLEEIIDYLRFGRTKIFEAISDLSERELTEIEIYEGWTIRDLLVHLIGWDEWVLRTIPLIVQDRADEIPPSVDPDQFNRQTLAVWQDKLFPEVMLALQTTQQKVIELVSSLDYKQIDTRRERGGRVITIRSYVIELFVEHERKHVSDIQSWRASLNSVLDPVEVQAFAEKRLAEAGIRTEPEAPATLFIQAIVVAGAQECFATLEASVVEDARLERNGFLRPVVSWKSSGSIISDTSAECPRVIGDSLGRALDSFVETYQAMNQ